MSTRATRLHEPQALRAAQQRCSAAAAAPPRPARRRPGHPAGRAGGGDSGATGVCGGTWSMEGDVVACCASLRAANHPEMTPVGINYRLRLSSSRRGANDR